jgi:hypothetical protein
MLKGLLTYLMDPIALRLRTSYFVLRSSEGSLIVLKNKLQPLPFIGYAVCGHAL